MPAEHGESLGEPWASPVGLFVLTSNGGRVRESELDRERRVVADLYAVHIKRARGGNAVARTAVIFRTYDLMPSAVE